MIRIEPEQWHLQLFAKALTLVDILRQPTQDYLALTNEKKDALRQSQIELNEVIRVLGFHDHHALIMKSDKVIGWVLTAEIFVDKNIVAFDAPIFLRQQTKTFFEHWQGTPYVWGGVTRSGIDCSGLSQQFYRSVLSCIIPKNSYDQRKAGRSKPLHDIANHDLVFCTRIAGRGIHHVGIYVEGEIWHAHGERGVIHQLMNDFLTDYQVLDVVCEVAAV